MFAKLLTFLLVASTAFAAHYRNTTTDTTYIQDTYIADNSSGQGDSVTNYGKNSLSYVFPDTRSLWRFSNLRTLLGSGRALGLCSLKVSLGPEATLGRAGIVDFYFVQQEWGEGWLEGVGGYRRAGASWRYRSMPSYPDTTPQASLPAAFTWRDSNLVTAIKNQAGCGSCYAHSATGAFEAAAKLQNPERQISYNSGNGVGADRVTAVDDIGDVSTTGWVVVTFRPSSMKNAYDDPTNKECGWVLTRSSGDYTFWTSEAANAANRPRVYILYGRHDGGIDEDLSAQFTGTTDISETVLKSGTDSTTNFGSDSLIQLNATNPIMLFKVNGVATKFGDSNLYIGEAVCSLKVKTVTTAGTFNANDALKKWVENEATSAIWQTGYRWGTFQSAKVNELDASEQQLLDCDPVQGCTGGSCKNALEYWRLNTLYSEEQYPYAAAEGTCDTAGLGSVNYANMKWWWPVDFSTRNKLKQAILIRPVTASIGYDAYYLSIDDGTCYPPTMTDPSIVHSVLLVGWDNAKVCGDSTGAWLVKDERGELWGEYGYGWVSFANSKVFKLQTFNPTTDLGCYIAETVNDPELWTSEGMQQGTDYDSNYFATITVTLDENSSYYVPIPADMMQAWYDNPSANFGIMAMNREGIPNGTKVQTTFVQSEATNPGLVAYKPQLIVHSSDRVTKIGNVKIGNVKIGN